jgi:hypothetical protein
VTDGLHVGAGVDVRLNVGGGDVLRFAQEGGDAVGVDRAVRHKVKFQPVARAQHERLAAEADEEFEQRRGDARLGDGQPLADRDRRRAETAAEQAQVHGSPPANGCDAASVASISTNAASEPSAKCRPRRCRP